MKTTIVISVLQLCRLDYAAGLRVQQELVDLRKADRIGDVLLLLEHTPVITLGRNAKAENILLSAEELALRGVEVYETNRGGDVTFHGPEQLVGYPILDLRGFNGSQLPAVISPERPVRKTLGVVDYVRRLEEVLIRTCAEFGIPAKRVHGLTGVWTTSEAKIAAIGVHISRGVTSHGFALNVNTDLGFFDLIVPCGIAAKPVTSMKKELGAAVDMGEVAESVSRNFGSVFARPMKPFDTLDALLGNTVGVPVKAPARFREMCGEDETFSA